MKRDMVKDHSKQIDKTLQLVYRKPRSKIKRRSEKKVWTVDAFTVEERSRNFARKKKCKITSHSFGRCGVGITLIRGYGFRPSRELQLALSILFGIRRTMEGLFFNVNGG